MRGRLKNLSDKLFKRIDFFLFHLCLIVLMQSMVVSGYLNSINTTIERRYKLTTKEIGLIYMSYELACIPTTIILSFIGHHFNRARIIGISGILMGIGFLMLSVPHFIGTDYQLFICNDNTTLALCNQHKIRKINNCSENISDRWAMLIFSISQICIGIGASPIYVLGPTYLWDNLSNKDYSIYSSIFYTFGGLGPPIGFLLGGAFLGIYIDTPKLPKCENMNSNHPLWLGAWWFGLVTIGSFTILIMLPLFKFPKKIAERKKIISSNKEPDISNNEIKEQIFTNSIGDIGNADNIKAESKQKFPFKLSTKYIPSSMLELRILFSNPIWIVMSIASVLEQSVIQACITYISKYLQIIFNVPANHASYVVGGVVVPGAILGVLFGGILMHKFQPSQNNTIKGIIFIISGTGILVFILMFMGCDDLRVVGVSLEYKNTSILNKYSLISDCNYECNCSKHDYEPVCNWEESRNFYSPCHAGCKSHVHGKFGEQTYEDCSCSTSKSLSVGKCAPYCPTYHISLVIVFFQVFITASGQIPVNIATLRSVSTKDSSMALGVQVFMVRLFAYIPVPLYFGALFDYACLVRVIDKCTKGSICYEYALSMLPFIWLGTVVLIKLINIVLILSIYIRIRERDRSQCPGRVDSRTTHDTINVENINTSNIKKMNWSIPEVKDKKDLDHPNPEKDRYLSFNLQTT